MPRKPTPPLNDIIQPSRFFFHQQQRDQLQMLVSLFRDPELFLALREMQPDIARELAPHLRQYASDQGHNIVIIGLGPAGLATAIAACRHAIPYAKIIAITNRPDYTRTQILRLDPDAQAVLRDLVGEEIYSRYSRDGYIRYVPVARQQSVTLPGPYYVVQTKQLEKMLYEALQAHGNRVEIMSVDRDYVPDIHKDDREIRLPGGRSIKFSLLIEADGAHHATANVMRAQGVNIEYQAQADGMLLHSQHAIGAFRVNWVEVDRYQMAIDTSDSRPSSAMVANMRQVGWQHQSAPEYRVFIARTSDQHATIYIGAETPEEVATDAERTSLWLRILLAQHVPVQDVLFWQLQEPVSAFNINIQEARHPTHFWRANDDVEVAYIRVGDALRTTHYQTGSGASMALLQVDALQRYLATRLSLIDLGELARRLRETLLANRNRVRAFNITRHVREVPTDTINLLSTAIRLNNEGVVLDILRRQAPNLIASNSLNIHSSLFSNRRNSNANNDISDILDIRSAI